MKLDFGNINQNHLNVGSVFFLYGNLKKTFDIFCEYIFEKSKEKFYGANLSLHNCSVVECAKIVKSRCDLFGQDLDIFCIKNVEDSHTDKLVPLFNSESSIFILGSGDYKRSKSITDYLMKLRNVYAIPSFKNDMTLISLCKMLLPKGTSPQIFKRIVDIINETDEEFFSLFKKVSILIEAGENDLLQDYMTYKTSFLENLEFIPMVRYLAKQAIKEKIYGQKQAFLERNLSQKGMIEKLLKFEVNQKIGTPLTKSTLEMAL